MSHIVKRKKEKKDADVKVVFKQKGNPKTAKEFVELVFAQNQKLEQIRADFVTSFIIDLSIVQNQLYSDILIKFNNLKDLRLDNCSLSNFYPEASVINKLKILSLKNNRLQAIQITYECQDLETCVLDGNLFTEIPKSLLGNAESLRELSIAKNKISSIPSDFFEKWEELVYLDISANKFKQIPNFWLKCNQLTHFRALLNQIEDIHPDMFNFASNLKLIVLDQNPISQLSTNIIKLEKLEVLSMSYTLITQIPKQTVQLPKLTLLNVENTPLKQPPLFCAMRGIKSIRSYFNSDSKATEEGSKYQKKSKSKQPLMKSVTSVNSLKDKANRSKLEKSQNATIFSEEQEIKDEEDEANKKAAQYTEKIMEEDFLWDVINLLHKNRDIKLEEDFESIRDAVLSLDPEHMYDAIAECLLGKIQGDEITELPQFAKGMKVIKQMKREKANTSYTGVKHSHLNVEKFIGNLNQCLIKDQMNVKLAMIRSQSPQVYRAIKQLMKRLDHIYNAKLALSFFNSILTEFLEEAKYYLSIKTGDLIKEDISQDQKMKLNFKNFVVKTDDFQFSKKIKPFPELYTLFRQCGFQHKDDYLIIDKSEVNKNKSLTVQNLIQLFMSSYQAI